MTDPRRVTIARIIAKTQPEFDRYVHSVPGVSIYEPNERDYALADALLTSGYCTPPTDPDSETGLTPRNLRAIAAGIEHPDAPPPTGDWTGPSLGAHLLRVWADLLTPTDPDAKRP